MGWFLLYLLIALQAAACVIAIVARVWRLSPEPIIWRGTDVDVAANNVERFLVDIDDSRFAYPTGMFVPDSTSDTNAGRVVMREENFSGSRGLGWGFRVFAHFHMAWQREWEMGRRHPLFMIFAWFFFMGIAACLAAPFVIAAVLDIGYRMAFRSSIRAIVTKHQNLEDAVNIQLEFRGLSAFGLVPDALRGMTAPVLPAGLVANDTSALDTEAEARTLAAVGGRAAAWAQGAEQRFRVIYGSAIGAAVAVALVLALAIQHGADYGYNSSLTSSENGNQSSSSEDSGPDSSTDTTSSDEDSSTSASRSSSEDAASASAFKASDGYTVEPPTGWIRNSDSKEKGGFTESRWHMAGNPEVYVLVDHTVGYRGTAREGATSVRKGIKQRADYLEYEWSRVDGDTWQWEFASNGARKIDRFVTACGDGYAALGAAPESDFETYRATIEAFVSSLAPPCDAGGASGSNDETGDTPPAGVLSKTRSGPAQVLRRHFQLISAGDYQGAFELLSASYRSRHSNWTSQPKKANPYINIGRTGPTSIAGRVAFVYIKFYGRDRVATAKSDTKCRRFEGKARMVKSGSQWRYDPDRSYTVREISSSLDVCNP